MLPDTSSTITGRMGITNEYCTTTIKDLSPIACVDLLEDIRSDVMGVSLILRAIANEDSTGEEQMLVCYGVLHCAAEALGALEEHLMAKARMG